MKRKYSILLITASLLLFSAKNYGQAPTLGATEGFCLFTKVGAFTVSGSNVFYGDVGTNNGSFTVPGSMTLIGNQHVQDSISALAATDVSTAYTDLSSLTCDSTISSTLGNGRVLTPGIVYCITTAATLNGNLILDGQSSSTSIFNINIDGAFSTNTSSTITLINGAKFCNVFWQVNGAFNMGASSVFKGTVIANGAISLLSQSELEGRALSIAGQITTSSNKVVGCDASGNALPVELLNFNAKLSGFNVELNWSTATELNNNYFTVQRSKDAIYFEDVVSIPGAGNSSMILHYRSIDYNPYNGTSYYRLKQTDFDGKVTYFHIVAIKVNKLFTFNIFPNPFTSNTSILFKNAANVKMNECELKIYNALGEEVMKARVTEYITAIDTKNLPSGIYYYKILSNQEIIQSGKMISQQ